MHVHFELARCDFRDYYYDTHDEISHAVDLSENRPLAGKMNMPWAWISVFYCVFPVCEVLSKIMQID